MSAAEKLDDTKYDVRTAAVEALASARGDLHKAVDAMERRVRTNSGLRYALTDPLIRVACYDSIRGVLRSQRKVIWNMPQPTTAQSRERVVALSRGTANALMDFTLPNGVPLRYATKSEVIEAADFYQKQADNMHVKAAWLRLISAKVPTNRIVQEALTEKQLIRMKAKVSRSKEESAHG